MARKRNEYLDLSDEEEQASSDLERAEDARDSRFSLPSVSSSKRRRLDISDEDASSTSDDEKEDGLVHSSHSNGGQLRLAQKPTESGEEGPEKGASTPTTLPSKGKPLEASQLAASRRRARKTGVIYISRVPPFMKPSTIRHLLAPHGTISRLFLTPEAPATHARRIRSGGNKKRSFIDGWVEFASKKDAKACAELLNGQIIGGKKGSWYHDDIWNMKYLRGFKWDDLMEQVQAEEKMREGRLRAEIQRDVRERKAFLRNVELAKRDRGMNAKRKSRLSNADADEEGLGKAGHGIQRAEAVAGVEVGKKGKFERSFRQNEVKVRGGHSPDPEQQDDAMRVLGKIF
jgi:ESF2/ABP1 family protein